MNKSIPLVLALVLLALLASACGQTHKPSDTNASSAGTDSAASANEGTAAEPSSSTHTYTDYKGRTVDVPNDPKLLDEIVSVMGR
ncbi:hypothetical protein GXP70_01385 [Paenibacillus lycopersici]|uniref:Uncharacterized protein n=1 Tax=Paenibacillus lycopersici TaxID=2704462 RepID=A0A6C0FUZ3_9BACL|nr:hypothetical protein [Paenibacillus lycopersici]QHT58759.1 hypothetical protein GXP70_01385 [Paenibacillus lycopersici]